MRWLFIAALLAGCAGAVYRDRDVQISSMAVFDPARYAGLWYKIARYDVPYERGCVGVTARYDLRPDGTLGILNSCRDGTPDGRLKTIKGHARMVGPGRLMVSFDNVPFVAAPYWVLWVDEGYRTAVVGVPSGRAGWILNREPRIPPDRLKAALQVLEFNGYDSSRLIFAPQVAP